MESEREKLRPEAQSRLSVLPVSSLRLNLAVKLHPSEMEGCQVPGPA